MFNFKTLLTYITRATPTLRNTPNGLIFKRGKERYNWQYKTVLSCLQGLTTMFSL